MALNDGGTIQIESFEHVQNYLDGEKNFGALVSECDGSTEYKQPVLVQFLAMMTIAAS